jgi:hypothetical protein
MSTVNEITSKKNRKSWWNDIKQELIVDHYYNNLPENFEAIILSGEPEQHNSAEELEAFGTEFEEKNDNRYYFVRIMPLKIQGSILPDPFRAKDDKVAKRLINMYPLAYISVGESKHPPTHGDIYQCRYVNNDQRGIALVERLRNSNEKIGKISNREIHKSFRGSTTLGSTGASGTGSGTPPADTSKSNYPACPEGTKKKTIITRAELMKNVKAAMPSPSEKWLAISIVATAITEQPISGGKVGGFNWNHWGIMADVGRGWGNINSDGSRGCSIVSAEGTGGSGDRRQKYRWFVAFRSAEDGVLFMKRKFGAKKGLPAEYKDAHGPHADETFKTVKDGFYWGKLHTYRWLSPRDKADRITAQSGEYYNKLKAKEKNWNQAKSLYENT